MEKYLTDIPREAVEFGLPKVLAVRREVIHIKHILTEVFVRKTVDIQKYLDRLDMSLFGYMEHMTNRLRRVHYLSREYCVDCNEVVKSDRDRFFPTLELLNGFSKCIALDFDGVVTENNFRELYKLCCERESVQICSANPTISESWFETRGMELPKRINSMRGKVKKIRRLLELQSRHDYVFYVDNELEYLEYAWLFGLQTYHWDGKQIKYFSLKTK